MSIARSIKTNNIPQTSTRSTVSYTIRDGDIVMGGTLSERFPRTEKHHTSFISMISCGLSGNDTISERTFKSETHHGIFTTSVLLTLSSTELSSSDTVHETSVGPPARAEHGNFGVNFDVFA